MQYVGSKKQNFFGAFAVGRLNILLYTCFGRCGRFLNVFWWYFACFRWWLYYLLFVLLFCCWLRLVATGACGDVLESCIQGYLRWSGSFELDPANDERENCLWMLGFFSRFKRAKLWRFVSAFKRFCTVRYWFIKFLKYDFCEFPSNDNCCKLD